MRESVDEQRETLAECATEATEVDVRIQIQPDGWVEDVRARGSARVGPCVERVIKSWRFGEAAGATQVELPIALEIPEVPEPADESSDENSDENSDESSDENSDENSETSDETSETEG